MNYEMRSHKLGKIIALSVSGLSFLLIIVFIVLFNVANSKKPLIKYPTYTLSETAWTDKNVTISITNDQSKIKAYSFDGGQNFQDSSNYEVIENGVFIVVVKDINDRLSNKITVPIRNIDKDAPQINFENPTTVQMGTIFNPRTGVIVTEDGSGLDNNYVATPSSIDTSHEGTYDVVYTAVDKVGNYTEKVRSIVVKDIVGRTYYRSRTISTENYQCEPYECNCFNPSSNNESTSCPTGFSINKENQCCQTCYKSCKKTNYGEWSEWTQDILKPTATLEVETKVE